MNNDHGRRFAVYSPTGVHIGLWPDGKIAAEVAAETPGNTVEELIRADHVDALLKAERERVLRKVAIELECNWGHIATPEMRKAILAATVATFQSS